MARQGREMFPGLAEFLQQRTEHRHDYLETTIRIAAIYNHILVLTYSLLTAGWIILLTVSEMSPWAGAALFSSCGLFVAGLTHTILKVFSAGMTSHDARSKILEEDSEDEDEDDWGEEGDRLEMISRNMSNSTSPYLILGFLTAGIAVAIEHWDYAWRALSVLAGLGVVMYGIAAIASRIAGRSTGSPETKDDSNA